MSRRIRCIAMSLALSALMAASVQAAPTKTLPKGSAPEVGLFTGAWVRLASWLRADMPTVLKALNPDSTSHLDPNGNP
jgi:hypothetical protein